MACAANASPAADKAPSAALCGDGQALPTIDIDEMPAWIDAAAPGSACVYFRGHLQVARSLRNVMRAERQRAAALGATASDAERHGLVRLVQRRHGADDYSYVMIRTSRPPS